VAYPGDEWEEIDPEAAGFDPVVLDDLAAEAEANASNCLVVTRRGRLVGEWYWNGTDDSTAQEVFSATKSYASTLVGIAEADGDLDIDNPASEYIPEWRDTESADVTVKNLLSNDSGRHWDPQTDYQGLLSAADRSGFAIDLSQDAPPGETWAYNNSAIQTLDAVVEAATGQQPAVYAEERLFGPIGMANSEMTTDGAGNTNMFFGLRSTCRDMARFGHLFLQKGTWDGTEVVPDAWVEEATGQPSQDIAASYGYLWWLNRPGALGNPAGITTQDDAAAAEPSQMAPDAPQDMYWALGLGGQVIQVDPGSETVVVRLGEAGGQATYGAGDAARVVTEALVEP
jgi:CubicO group peptidase (beta-lactamase class C family)